MQDPYAGQPGTFYTDPDSGQRLTAEQWADRQRLSRALAKPAQRKTVKPPAVEPPISPTIDHED